MIGSFHVEATFAAIYRRLADTALAILVTQAAQTFLVSLFILYIFHYLVTRHLSAIAAELAATASRPANGVALAAPTAPARGRVAGGRHGLQHAVS